MKSFLIKFVAIFLSCVCFILAACSNDPFETGETDDTTYSAEGETQTLSEGEIQTDEGTTESADEHETDESATESADEHETDESATESADENETDESATESADEDETDESEPETNLDVGIDSSGGWGGIQ